MSRRKILVGLLAATAFIAAIWMALGQGCGAATTVLLVRHADREPGQDRLSTVGLERAKALALAVRRAHITAIYQTQFKRTQETAEPAARALGLAPITVDAKDTHAVADDIEERRMGQTVLVVGHGNTVPQVIAALGGPAIADLDEGAFGDMWVLHLCRCISEQVTLTQLRYGED